MEEENKKSRRLQNIITWVIGVPLVILLVAMACPYDILVKSISLGLIGLVFYIAFVVIKFVCSLVIKLIRKIF